MNRNILQITENILEKLFTRTFLVLTIVVLLGLCIRIYFTPWNLPSNSPDAFVFMVEGIAYAKGDFTYFVPRFLWSAFISIFFAFFNFDNYFGYMTVMRIVSISISVATIPILYLISKQFVEKKYAVIATVFFTIESNLVENSIFAITEPMFIFLGLISFYFAMQRNDRYLPLAFFFAGLSFDTRLNGIVLFVLVLYSCLIRIRTRKTWLMLLIGLSIFMVVISPHIIYPLESKTMIFPAIQNAVDTISNERTYVSTYEEKPSNVLINALENEFLHIFRISVPYLFLLFPFGIIIALTNMNNQTKLAFIVIITSLIIAIPQYTISNEYRNLFFLTPFLCIFSVIGIQKITQKVELKNIFLILLICGILLLSFNFLRERYDVDQEEILERDNLGKYIANNFEGGLVGDLQLEIVRNMPDIRLGKSLSNDHISVWRPEITIDTTQKLLNYIYQNKINYLVIEDKLDEKHFPVFREIFHNEENFPFMKKVFYSHDEGYKKIQVKVFEINHDEIKKLITLE